MIVGLLIKYNSMLQRLIVFFRSQTQQIAGSQPKSNSSRGPSSSHETQSPIQVTASNNQKLEVNLNASGGSTSKQHLEPYSSNLEATKTSVGTTNAPNSSNASKGKLNSSTLSHQLPSETAATKYVVSGLFIIIFSMHFKNSMFPSFSSIYALILYNTGKTPNK